MYAKCGKLSEAEELFNSLSARDVVSWNALISGYVRHGFGEEALKLFQKMQLEGCKPTAVTFVSCLKACTLLKDMDQCQIFDAEVRSNGLEHDPFVGIALIDMHAKCGFLERAEEAFQELPTRNVVSWTALMKGYIDHGRAEQALTCFEKMQEEGVSPDAAAFLCALKSCSRTGNIVMGQKLHADISRMSVERDHLLDCALVDMYCKFGLLNKAQEIFMELPTKDVMLWNTLMGGFIDHGQGDKALWCYDQMLQNDICLSSVSFVLGLKACGNLLDIQKGKEIHVEVCKRDLERDLHVGSTLVDMYSKCGALEIAQEVFDKLSSQDVVSWTSLIGGYTDHGKGLEALIRFKLMQDEGIAPNAVTFSCILKACGNEGAVRKGRETHAMIAKTELLEKESIVGSALVYMYAKCGLPARAKEAFDVEAVQDIITRNVLIAGYAQLGECGTALNILNEMIGEGEKPTPVTFVSILNACSHAGLVDLGLMCFDRMKTDFSMVPSVEHHTCVIDLLCRAGQIENALSLINEMQISPDLAIWHSLLGACQQGGNVELGKHAFEHAVHIDGLDATAYVSWSNVYHDDEG
ncbi:hypothetical protein KP509_23G038700 [Ceratopteris richardii]|nr:hypothetical protein KP509_23G038700 [Ceratopteris richardii]